MNERTKACLDNAKYLLDAAKLLLNDKFYGPSSSLAILSIEECGKAFTVDTVKEDEKLYKKMRGEIKSHRDKLEIASFDKFFSGIIRTGLFEPDEHPIVSKEKYLQKLKECEDSNNEEFKELMTQSLAYEMFPIMKERGFYVDFQGESILTPLQTSEKAASYLVEEAERRLKEFKHDREYLWK